MPTIPARPLAQFTRYLLSSTRPTRRHLDRFTRYMLLSTSTYIEIADTCLAIMIIWLGNCYRANFRASLTMPPDICYRSSTHMLKTACTWLPRRSPQLFYQIFVVELVQCTLIISLDVCYHSLLSGLQISSRPPRLFYQIFVVYHHILAIFILLQHQITSNFLSLIKLRNIKILFVYRQKHFLTMFNYQ